MQVLLSVVCSVNDTLSHDIILYSFMHYSIYFCESMFPAKYGHVIDFAHVYDDEVAAFGDDIEWLPEPEARFNQGSE